MPLRIHMGIHMVRGRELLSFAVRMNYDGERRAVIEVRLAIIEARLAGLTVRLHRLECAPKRIGDPRTHPDGSLSDRAA